MSYTVARKKQRCSADHQTRNLIIDLPDDLKKLVFDCLSYEEKCSLAHTSRSVREGVRYSTKLFRATPSFQQGDINRLFYEPYIISVLIEIEEYETQNHNNILAEHPEDKIDLETYEECRQEDPNQFSYTQELPYDEFLASYMKALMVYYPTSKTLDLGYLIGLTLEQLEEILKHYEHITSLILAPLKLSSSPDSEKFRVGQLLANYCPELEYLHIAPQLINVHNISNESIDYHRVCRYLANESHLLSKTESGKTQSLQQWPLAYSQRYEELCKYPTNATQPLLKELTARLSLQGLSCILPKLPQLRLLELSSYLPPNKNSAFVNIDEADFESFLSDVRQLQAFDATTDQNTLWNKKNINKASIASVPSLTRLNLRYLAMAEGYSTPLYLNHINNIVVLFYDALPEFFRIFPNLQWLILPGHDAVLSRKLKYHSEVEIYQSFLQNIPASLERLDIIFSNPCLESSFFSLCFPLKKNGLPWEDILCEQIIASNIKYINFIIENNRENNNIIYYIKKIATHTKPETIEDDRAWRRSLYFVNSIHSFFKKNTHLIICIGTESKSSATFSLDTPLDGLDLIIPIILLKDPKHNGLV